MSSPARDSQQHRRGDLRAVLAALAANVGIAVTKLIAFLFTGSASMLAEFVHSLADCSDQVLLLIGRNRAERGETEEHPFGFGRERYFYGFIVSVVLFTVGGAYSVYDGIDKILHPEAITDPLVAFGVLAIAAVMEGFSLRTAVREANQQRGRNGWGEFIRRTKVPDLIIVLLEDSAALTGLVFAFAGIGLAELTGDGAWDGGGSVAIGLLLALVAAVVAVETKSLLIGESASPEALQTIVNALEDGPELEGVIHMRTVHLSPDSLLVAAKVAVRGDEPAAKVVRGIDIAEGRVRAALPIARVIYLEPDIYREERADQADPAIRSVQRVSRRRRIRRPGRPAGPGTVAAQPGSAAQPGEPAPAVADQRDPSSLAARTGGRPSSRRARSCSKSSARPGASGPRPTRRPRSATAARTAGSDRTRRPNASEAGLIWYRRSSWRAAATASRSAVPNCRWPGPPPGPGLSSRTGGSRPRSSRYRSIRGDNPRRRAASEIRIDSESYILLSETPSWACGRPAHPIRSIRSTTRQQGRHRESACPPHRFRTRSLIYRWPPSGAKRSSWPSTRCRA
jgi:cation diffusion facilitator family transporter